MMGKRRFKTLGSGSFFGTLVYDRAVPQGHFLRQLEQLLDWSAYTEKLLRLYQGGAEIGRPPCNPAVILKMLLLSHLYDLSERQTEVYVNDSLSAKCFLGLAVDEPAPDHTTLTTFKGRIVEGGGEACLQELLVEIVRQAQERGVAFGSVQVVDSTHTVADVNTSKDERRQKKGGGGPRDGGARWGVKHTKRCRNEKGEVVTQREYFYGYKMHTSMNAEAEMITSVVVTAGNGHDGKQFAKLVERDEVLGLPIETYAGDRGYDGGENHYLLESKGLHSAIRLNDYRTEKKDKNKGIWLGLLQSPAYQEGQRVRYKIERKYGEGKENHGLRRCRYLGWTRYAIQAYLTALVLNLKRMVRLLTGTSFRGRARLAA
jgi:IS5 family transposase